MGDNPFRGRRVLSVCAFFLSACCRIARYSTTEAQRRASWSLSRSKATRAFCFLTKSTIPSKTSDVIT